MIFQTLDFTSRHCTDGEELSAHQIMYDKYSSVEE